MSRRLFTSESVTEGHPDKIADQISDAILDALLKEDPHSRVAVETLITTGQVHVAGEVTTEAYADIPTIVRERDPRDRLRLVEEGLRRRVLRRERLDRRRSRPTSPRASTTPTRPRDGEGIDDARPAGRRRPGPDVRLRLRRHPRADAAADRARAPAGPAAVRGPQGRHRRRTCARTARPRSPSSTTSDKPVRLDTVVVSSQHAADIDLDDAAQARRRGARGRARAGRRSTSTPTATGCWSTRPAASRSAARWATPA